MRVVKRKLVDLKPYANNPRVNKAAVDYVAASLKEFGWQQPIVIDKDNVIIAGHTRYQAAKKLGWEEAECKIASELTAEQVKAYRLADNKVAEMASWDYDLLAQELDEIADMTDKIDMAEFGFERIAADEYGTEFDLPDEDTKDFRQMTFTVHEEQYQAIEEALKQVKGCRETFGNGNKHGNALYEVVMEWAEQKK